MARNYSSVAPEKTLSTDVSAVATTITLNNLTGLPSYPYALVINPDTVLEEIVVATSLLSGTTINVTRAAESSSTAPGSTAKAHTVGNKVRHMITARDLQDFTDHAANTTTAHGVSGSVVGTTSTQVLTNKTLNAPTTLNSPTINTPTINAGAGGTLAISSTELGYLDGVSGNIQTLLDLKAPVANPQFTGTVILPSTTSVGTVSSTEIGYLDGVTSLIQAQINSLIPKGTVTPFAGATAPSGNWLMCDGSTKNTSTNPELADLYAVIGTTYGGTGSTSFKLPDLRGRTPIGAGTGTGLTARALNDTIGVESVTLTSGQSGVPAHSHANTVSFSDPGHAHTVYLNDGSGTGTGNFTDSNPTNDSRSWAAGSTNSVGTGASVGITNVNNTAANAAEAHTNMQPSLALNYIIKY